MKVALFGANSRVGRNLLPLLQDFIVHSITRAEVNVTNQHQVLQALNLIEPSIIINCAAFTNVDKAETAREECFQTNVEYVSWLLDWAEARKAFLVHLSTDYVFDGEARTPYRESDVCNPLNFYGFSKLASEKLCISYEKSLVIRTCYLFSSNTQNLVTFFLEKLKANEKLRVVKKQVISLTNILDLSLFLVTCIKKTVTGLFHFANEGEVSIETLVLELAKLLHKEPEYLLVEQEELARPARRPLYSALNCSKSSSIYKPIDWHRSISYTFAQVK